MGNETIEIGKFIKKARLDKGLTIRALAEKTGITPSMLSQIERDLANPSINTLKTLSVELNVPLYTFFKSDDVDTKSFIVKKNQRKTIGNPANNMSYDLLTPDVRGTIEFCIAHFAPNANEDPVSLSHEGEETALVLSGKINVSIEGTIYTLTAGDSVRIPSHTSHYWVNPYDKICDIVFAITPPSF